MTPTKPRLVIVGQTPPPWHGQAVATKMLFDAEWPGFDVRRVRLAFSEEMEEVGRAHPRKIGHLFEMVRSIRRAADGADEAILFYPPASPNWIPFLRDLILVPLVRKRFQHRVFLFHAGGVGEWLRRGWLRRMLGAIAYQGCDLALEVAKEKMPAHRAIRARHSAWTPYGVEVPDWQRPVARNGPMEVLFVGSLQEGKGVLQVIETADRLKRLGSGSGFRFRLVGRWFSDSFRKVAEQRRRTLGVEDMVDFVGQLTGEDKWCAYRQADLFFFPTHYESEAFPLVLIEALGMGLGIITTHWRGIPDMLDGCAAARVLPVRDPDAYANALLECQNQRSPGRSDSAREFYESRYRPADFLAQVAELITQVVGAKPTTAVHAKGCRTLVPRPRPVSILAYVADQNPRLGRSLGISRMTEVVLDTVGDRDDIELGVVTSKSSIQGAKSAEAVIRVPWSTRSNLMRVVTDNVHPLLTKPTQKPDVWYFPKGFMPHFYQGCMPAVATIHDTIIQYYQDHYPKWRLEAEYSYWAGMLRNTLTHAAAVMTVSERAEGQIEDFIRRHKLPEREIHVTYEPCLYESIPQPENPAKADYVLHLGSIEPHKRTAWLVRTWAEAVRSGRELPQLHVVGKLPEEVQALVEGTREIVYLPFLEDRALVSQFTAARALIFPSEVEGFGLPAIEAYYLGTPVCYTADTSIEEVLGPATRLGGFHLDDPGTLWSALDEVLAIPAEDVRDYGLKLREVYSSKRVVERMMEVFRSVSGTSES